MGKVASILTKPLPGSPAEIGPLSGQGYSLIRGQHLIEDLTSGVSDTNSLKRAMGDVADLMSLSLNDATAFDAMTGPVGASGSGMSGSGSGGMTINVEAGAVQLTLGEGVDPEAAAAAFAGSADTIAEALLSALQRR